MFKAIGCLPCLCLLNYWSNNALHFSIIFQVCQFCNKHENQQPLNYRPKDLGENDKLADEMSSVLITFVQHLEFLINCVGDGFLLVFLEMVINSKGSQLLCCTLPSHLGQCFLLLCSCCTSSNGVWCQSSLQTVFGCEFSHFITAQYSSIVIPVDIKYFFFNHSVII